MRKLSKNRTLCVVLSGRLQCPSPGIFETEAVFFWGRGHLKGSEQPQGTYDRAGLSDSEARVVFQGDNRSPEYAPRISYSLESAEVVKLGTRIARAATCLRQREGEITRAKLVEELGATPVAFAGDAWTWRSFQPSP